MLKRGLLLLNNDTDQLIHTASSLGFDGIEIPIDNNIDAYTTQSVACLINKCNEFRLYMAAHAPSLDIRLDSGNDGIRFESLRQILKSIEIFDPHINYLTIHTGYVQRYGKHGALEHVICSLRKISDLAKKTNLQICIENVYESTIDEILNYFDLSERDNLKMTLDLSHALVYGNLDVLQTFRVMKDIVFNIHISNNNGKDDQHLPINQGIMPIRCLIEKIISLGFNGYLTIEARTPKEAASSLSTLDKLIDNYTTKKLRNQYQF